MSEEVSARELATDAIRAAMPDREPDRTWAGPGTGTECAVCSAAITPSEIEYEIEFTGEAGPCTFHAHARCFGKWHAEREPR